MNSMTVVKKGLNKVLSLPRHHTAILDHSFAFFRQNIGKLGNDIVASLS